MFLRSWHVALLGIVLQVAFGLLFFGALNSGGFGGIIIGMLGLFFLVAGLLALIPFAFLLFEKTRTLGAFLCIIFGTVGIVTQVGIIAGLFLLAAGLLHLWKKI